MSTKNPLMVTYLYFSLGGHRCCQMKFSLASIQYNWIKVCGLQYPVVPTLRRYQPSLLGIFPSVWSCWSAVWIKHLFVSSLASQTQSFVVVLWSKLNCCLSNMCWRCALRSVCECVCDVNACVECVHKSEYVCLCTCPVCPCVHPRVCVCADARGCLQCVCIWVWKSVRGIVVVLD